MGKLHDPGADVASYKAIKSFLKVYINISDR